MSQYHAKVKPLSIVDLQQMKHKAEKISCLTAYDASFSALLDNIGLDMMLVGDSLGMVIQGNETTLPVTMTDMIYHCRQVVNARQRAFVVADLPFMSYATPLMAAENAMLLMQQGKAQMVKLEGSRLETIAFLVKQGIPVCSHLGLLPQSINQLGRYFIQGKDKPAADKILADAIAIEKAGASLLIVECIPASLARTISEQLSIPVIGIGAGVDCDGQVLVLYDMLNISLGKYPKFSKDYLTNNVDIEAAVKDYISEVKQATFPTLEHSF